MERLRNVAGWMNPVKLVIEAVIAFIDAART